MPCHRLAPRVVRGAHGDGCGLGVLVDSGEDIGRVFVDADDEPQDVLGHPADLPNRVFVDSEEAQEAPEHRTDLVLPSRVSEEAQDAPEHQAGLVDSEEEPLDATDNHLPGAAFVDSEVEPPEAPEHQAGLPGASLTASLSACSTSADLLSSRDSAEPNTGSSSELLESSCVPPRRNGLHLLSEGALPRGGGAPPTRGATRTPAMPCGDLSGWLSGLRVGWRPAGGGGPQHADADVSAGALHREGLGP